MNVDIIDLLLCLSMNHIIGDGCTLYRVFNMLNQENNNKSIISMNVEREDYVKKALDKTGIMGNPENGYDGDIMVQYIIQMDMPYMMKALSRQFKEKYKPKAWNFKFNME